MKELLKTKSFWTGAGMIVSAFTATYYPEYSDQVNKALMGLAVIFLRQAIQPQTGQNPSLQPPGGRNDHERGSC